ncbi:MAG: hypothetical protein AB7G93_08730 [Bdellovibrionales bacterium]
MRGFIRFAALFAVALAFVACGKGKDAEPESPFAPAPPEPFTHKVSGPDLTGKWTSGCERDAWGDGHVIFTITFDSQDVLRREAKYADRACQNKVSELERKGKFRYKADLSGGIYELEYRFDIPNGYYVTGDNVSRSQNRLWISDRHIGPGVVPHIPLDLVK